MWYLDAYSSCFDSTVKLRTVLFLLITFPATILAVTGPVPAAGPLHLPLEPESVVVRVGEPAALHCRPPPAATVAWRHGGLVLTNTPERRILGNSTLAFAAVRPSDQGQYQCQVTLAEGGILLSRTASLQLAELAATEQGAAVLSLFLGRTARLRCGVAGRPTPRFSWLRDDQPLTVDQSRALVLPSGALELDQVRMQDSGTYVCRADNAMGLELGPPTRLTINTNFEEANRAEAPSFAARPVDTAALLGDTVTLDCAANGNPPPSITWLKDGTTIDMSYLDRRFFYLGVSSLQIVGVQEEDSGTYQCRVVNRIDSADATAVLRVIVAPTFEERPSDTTAVQKEDVELHCQARGVPPPTITWTKNGEKLHNSDYFKLKQNGHSLRILGLVERDAGVYQCFATNSAGNVQTAARLSVLPPGGGRSRNGGASAAGDDDVTDTTAAAAPREVTARVVGARFVTLTWREPLSTAAAVTFYTVTYRRLDSERERVLNTSAGAGSPSQQIQGLQPDTEYVFRVVANTAGAAGRGAARLQLRTQPEPTVPAAPLQLHLLPIGSTRLRASWAAVTPPPLHYMLYVAQSAGGDEERVFNTNDTQFVLTGLRKYTSYTMRVCAVNADGPGPSTAEVSARTWGDKPSETPQNITIETSSDTSVVVRWEPPPADHRNGPLTGYKIRYKRQDGGGRRDAHTVVTDAIRRSFTLSELQKNAEYLVKMAALTANGTGPFTRWHRAQLFHRLQVETAVPDRPASLVARPTEDTITVVWSPPRNTNILVRGYTIGWGRGVPDSYTEVIDEKQHFYVIKDLVSNAEYVVSLRALNAAGNGTPIYETLWTRPPEDQMDRRPLVIPTGLKVNVVSESEVVLYWTDRSLPNQVVNDGRMYQVRYASQANAEHFRYHNASQLNCMLENLRPATTYEFSVQAVKGHRQSSWSLIVVNNTHEAPPSTPPRDLTIVQSEDNPAIINLSWQPPKTPNGRIDGYVIQYTADRSLPDREWQVHPVVGDQMTTTLTDLTPTTVYWFRIQARNAAGNSPVSRSVRLHTSSDPGYSPSGRRRSGGGGGLGDHLLYVVAACAVTLLLVVVIIVTVCLCKRKPSRQSPRRGHKSNSYVKGQTGIGTPDLKPPDLWIHHDQTELRPMAKQRSDSCSTLRRHSPDFEPDERAYASTLDRRDRHGRTQSPGPSKGNSRSEDRLDKQLQRRSVFKPKPIVVPIDVAPHRQAGTSATALANGTVETRPVYPRTQFSISRTLGNEPPPPPAPTAPESHYGAGLGLASASSSEAAGPVGLPAGYPASTASSLDSGSLGKRTAPPAGSHPLKSFGCPAPPPPLAAGRPLGSPLKKPAFACSPRPADGAVSREELAPLRPSYSTEELTQEMANLEGLMKDLNAITASEFQC